VGADQTGPAIAGAQNEGTSDLSVVVPVRNAERIVDDCLASIVRSGPREIIVVDGMSTDGTVDAALRYPVELLSDEGRGLPAARLIGAKAAKSVHVALVDSDVVLPEGALEELLDEFLTGRYDALQAGIASVSGPGYWGRALVAHHRSVSTKASSRERTSSFVGDCNVPVPTSASRGGRSLPTGSTTLSRLRAPSGWRTDMEAGG